MVLEWDAIEWWTGSAWQSLNAVISGAHWLDETDEELNGDEKFTFTMSNNATNRAFVAEDRDVRLKYDGEVIFTGILSGVEYSKLHIFCIVYNSVYEKLKRAVIEQTFNSEPADDILDYICMQAGVTAGTCPSTTLSLRLHYTNGYEAVRFIAYLLGLDYWSDGDTLNLGVRDRCVLALPMDEGSGTTVEDLSGHGFSATMGGGATWATGKYGYGINFDGSSGGVYMPDDSRLQPQEISISLWAKPTNITAGNRELISKTTAYLIRQNAGTLYWHVYDGVDYESHIEAGNIFSAGNWVHIVATANAETQRLYVNGVEVGSSPLAHVYAPTGTEELHIGYWTDIEYFAGVIDEVKIYNRVLSAEEVAFLYHEKIKGANPRGVDRSKLRDKVYVIGKDDDGDEVIGSAGTGNSAAVFRETKASDETTLNLLAEKKLAELNTTDSSIRVQLFSKFCAKLLLGDIISLHNDALALSGMYRIQKLTKGVRYIDCELGKRSKTQEELLAELQQFAEFGAAVLPEIAASDTERWTNDTMKETMEGTYTKIKEVKINTAVSGSLRIKFSASVKTTETPPPVYTHGYLKVYKNGVAVGAAFEVTVNGVYPMYYFDWTPCSRDVNTGFAAGDLLQIYAYVEDAVYMTVAAQEMKICFDPAAAISFTNQDP